VIGGVLLMALGPFIHEKEAPWFLLGLVGIMALALVVYSFAIYRRPDAGKGVIP
jgi:hypothetical protein